jgi:hypothetical protein
MTNAGEDWRVTRASHAGTDSRDGVMKVVDLIELHDSTIEFRREPRAVVVLLRPAYVHHWEDAGSGWIGTGRTQDARIVIACLPESVAPFGPSDVWDGMLRVGDSQFDLIPAPLHATGPVIAKFDLRDGTSVAIDGTEVRVEFVGSPTEIEPLPPEWAPKVDPSNKTLQSAGRVCRSAPSRVRR